MELVKIAPGGNAAVEIHIDRRSHKIIRDVHGDLAQVFPQAFEDDAHHPGSQVHNANESFKGIKPRRKVGKGRADALPQAHQLLRQGSPRRQAVGRPQL